MDSIFNILNSCGTVLLYSAIFLVVYYLYWFGYGKYRVLSNLGIRGPKPLPFIGHLADLARNKFQIHLYFDNYVKKYGKCFGFYFLGTPALCVSDPEMLRQILVKEFPKFHSRSLFRNMPEPVNSFLNVIDGERWKFIRGTLNPSFSSGKLRPMSGMMNEITDTFIEKCTVAAKNQQAVDIANYLQGLTMEVILSAAFGVKADTQTDPNDTLTSKAKQALQNPPWLSFIALIPGGDKIIKYLPYGFDYLVDPMLQVAKDIIEKRREAGSLGRKDLLQSMLEAQGEPDRDGRVLTDIEVVAQSIIFLIAGYETSSSTLALTCYFLATHPDVQEKAYKEVKEVLPDSQEIPDYDAAQALEYLDMVISETLRLYPPGFMLIRMCHENCVINGFPIKKGFSIVAPAYSIHRDPDVWTDPEKFDPERFSSENKATRNPFSYLPFGHGPRHCIGLRFAQMEMKIVLARLLHKFILDVCKETEIPPKVTAQGTLSVRGPLKLNLKLRNKEE